MSGKLKIIIGLLIKKTQSKEISWEKLNDNAYEITFIGSKIVINNYTMSFRENKKVHLLIYNQNKEVICSTSEDDDKELKELYKLANANYFNIDDTMTNIIQALM